MSISSSGKTIFSIFPKKNNIARQMRFFFFLLTFIPIFATVASANEPDKKTWMHGQLISHQPLALDSNLTAVGATGIRITYLTTRHEIQEVPSATPLTHPTDDPTIVTGVIIVPPGKAPSGGWPVVSFGAGGFDIADIAAPSREYPFSSYSPYLALLVKAGFAVVTSDYEGLGSQGARPFFTPYTEGRSMVDIVFAARELMKGSFSKNWFAVGHSSGGHASLDTSYVVDTGYAEGLNFKGTVAIEPAANFTYLTALETPVADTIDLQNITGGQITRNIWIAFLVGQKEAHNSFLFSDYLGPDALAVGRLDLPYIDTAVAVETKYLSTAIDQFKWQSEAARVQLRTYLDAAKVPLTKLNTPVMYAVGQPQSLFPPIWLSARDACLNGTTTLYKLYPETSPGHPNHNEMPVVSAPDVIKWMQDRLKGIPASMDCSQLPPNNVPTDKKKESQN
jgi:hypothetical protein